MPTELYESEQAESPHPPAPPKEHVLATSKGVTNPLVLIQSAIDRGTRPEDLGKLLDLQERWERNRAAEAFAEAITGFQSKMPPIFKGRKATGKLTFAYASFDDIMRVAGPILAEYRIVPTFTTEPAEGKGIKATCRIRVGIHSEETCLTLPIPAGVVNDTQLFGQAVSYAKRYALCAALNIVVTDEDNDAAAVLSGEHIVQINEMIESCRQAGHPVDFGKFLAWLNVTALEEVPQADFLKIVSFLNRKRGAK